jgi:invasion protein IalB
MPFVKCAADGPFCSAALVIDDERFARMKNAKTVRVVASGRGGEAANLAFPLSGFSEAWAARESGRQ